MKIIFERVCLMILLCVIFIFYGCGPVQVPVSQQKNTEGDNVFNTTQDGDIIAGDKNVNVNIKNLNIKSENTPRPKLEATIMTENEPFKDLYKTEILITIESKVPSNNLYLQFNARSIVKFERPPISCVGGGSVNITTGINEDNTHYINLRNPFGSYITTIYTKEIESIGINYKFQ